MKIVADENIPALEPLFSAFADTLVRRHGRHLTAEDVVDADVLLVRSITPVNAELLAGSRVRFVGSATIGTDHLDSAWLTEQGITHTAAPGCNADAVVDYVLANLFRLEVGQGFNLLERRIGVVGAGNVGGRLVKRLQNYGCDVLVCDPPRAEREGEAGFCDLDTVLQQADIICCHTPLIRDGDWPSWHMISTSQLQQLKPNAILLNAGRGSVIDEQALLTILETRSDLSVVLDVWEHEPSLFPALAEYVDIATPHIAGYSLEGKVRGTWMLYQTLCRFLGHSDVISLESLLPPPRVSEVLVAGDISPAEVVRLAYDPLRDDRALRQTLGLDDVARGEAFDRLRRDYPVRREFSSLSVRGEFNHTLRQRLSALGFRVNGGTA